MNNEMKEKKHPSLLVVVNIGIHFYFRVDIDAGGGKFLSLFSSGLGIVY